MEIEINKIEQSTITHLNSKTNIKGGNSPLEGRYRGVIREKD